MRFSAAAFADDAPSETFAQADELIAGERVCSAPARGPNIVARIYAALALGVGLALLTLKPMPQVLDAVSSWTSHVRGSGDQSSAVQQVAAPLPVAERSVPDMPDVAGAVAAAPTQDASHVETEEASAGQGTQSTDATPASQSEPEGPAAEIDAARPEPLQAPHVDPSDHLLVRALAVGLNPALSRGLLNRLSAADYANAGKAIQTALGSASNDEIIVWPRRQQKRLAQFEVHFVTSASRDCRRYVVKVAKDGWATTALPMEKCGYASG